MSRLFVDITELVGWTGKLTGVPRVMDELASRIDQNLPEALFVYWRPEGYHEIDYEAVNDREPDPRPITVVPTIHVRIAKKLYQNSRATRKVARVVRTQIARINRHPTSGSTVQIRNGDVLFMLADWHGGDPSFLQYLKQAKSNGVKLVQMVYDMLPIVTPQYSGHSTEMLKTYSTQVYPICELLFSISENTKKDITTWLMSNKLRVPRIEVVRLGDDFSKIAVLKPQIDVPKEYLLCVGTIEARKNHTLLYYTYKLAKQRKLDIPKIVLVGRVGWLAEDIYKIITADPDTKDQFIILHGVNDNELSWLYENCLFTVYPSFYEGWGLPIAESIAHGKTVAASNTSSMPEIAGDLINYFTPSSPEQCLASISHLLISKNRKSAVQKLRAYTPHSWDQTYDIISTAIKEL